MNQIKSAKPKPEPLAAEIEKRVSQLFICYAASLHRFFNARGRSPGYASPFETPKLYPGRVAAASQMPNPAASEVAQKPWLADYRRLIFVSDMGDALSKDVPFDFLLNEIVRTVTTEAGKRHIWLWLSKRPRRMAEFSDWLEAQGIEWPDNLVAMTSVTGPKTVGRVQQLLRVRALHRGLSVEPLWGKVSLPLEGIDWVIVGGESGKEAQPFHAEWAEQIIGDCKAEEIPVFLKQLGKRPFYQGQALSLTDSHGGDWNEWPHHLRVRELPGEWKQTPANPSESTQLEFTTW